MSVIIKDNKLISITVLNNFDFGLPKVVGNNLNPEIDFIIKNN